MTGTFSIQTVDLDNPQEIAEIDNFLVGRPDATPFHRPAWIMAVVEGNGQTAHMLAARDGAGEIAGLLPLNVIHSPLFGRALVSSGFAVDGGIITDFPSIADALAAEAVRLSQLWSCPTVELRGGHAPGAGWITKSDSYLGFERAIAETDEAELLAVPRKHRAELRRGLGNELDVQFGTDEEFRDAHYALYCRNVHNLGTPVFPRAMFEAVLDAFGDAAEIVMVSKDTQPLTTVLTLYHGARSMPYWQGADRDARVARSNEVAYFALMRRAHERGCTIFDFGRSKVGTGPAQWKKTWGFDGEPLSYYIHAAPGHEPRDINPLSPQYRRKIAVWKALPKGVADRLGPLIARGLG